VQAQSYQLSSSQIARVRLPAPGVGEPGAGQQRRGCAGTRDAKRFAGARGVASDQRDRRFGRQDTDRPPDLAAGDVEMERDPSIVDDRYLADQAVLGRCHACLGAMLAAVLADRPIVGRLLAAVKQLKCPITAGVVVTVNRATPTAPGDVRQANYGHVTTDSPEMAHRLAGHIPGRCADLVYGMLLWDKPTILVVAPAANRLGVPARTAARCRGYGAGSLIGAGGKPQQHRSSHPDSLREARERAACIASGSRGNLPLHRPLPARDVPCSATIDRIEVKDPTNESLFGQRAFRRRGQFSGTCRSISSGRRNSLSKHPLRSQKDVCYC
jgi:hypothetical protein